MALSASPPDPTARPWHQRLSRFGHRPGHAGPDAIDLAIAVGCFAVFTLPVLLGAVSGAGSTPAIAALGAAAVIPLIVRRRWPLAVLIAVAVVLCLAALLGVRFTPWVSNTGPAFGVAVLTMADLRSRRESLWATGLALVALYITGMTGMRMHPDQEEDFVQLLIAVPAWLIGDMIRTRRDYRDSIAAQRLRQAAEEERRIRAEERLRVSRDVHDLISHTLSMVAVRSGVARLVLDEQPGEARQALSAIETASRSALTELRRVLAQIREPGREPEADEPGLAEIDGLVAGLRHDGLTVEYAVIGAPADYPALLQTTAYRIVQEALTNVVKHAHTGRARVEIRHAAHELSVCVSDDGPVNETAVAPDSSGSGLGLVGMRERVSLFGGDFEAGPRPGGGFAVTARFPIEAR
ncbi:signal transduction histidine kinase [Nocardia tenerifensis]|uniref:histidine kinase n=1 Tax=Nocardia tenerifensis TaxID=228006 RepID=A0A318KFY3_9NOCA|nr:histidine kinase [Nocardia tenerifensis]PXX71162.1 signal transduction histidine kinase [Nocardia tenerifensis]